MIQVAEGGAKDKDIKAFYKKLGDTVKMHRDHAADLVATLQTQPTTGTSGSTTTPKH
jgi:hypothetical protein